MRNTLSLALYLLLTTYYLLLVVPTHAQTDIPWSTAGANPARTSWVGSEAPGLLKALWVKRMVPYVSVKTQVIGAENKVFVSTSRGVYAFDADTGNQVWVYGTELPISHSPTYSNGVVYAAGLDRKIHAINVSNGTKKWVYDTSPSGGAGFSTSPLVAENTVFAGGRDGCLYAIDANNGVFKWKYHIEGTAPILYSAAYANGKVFFGAQDGNAYALTTSGSLVWKVKLPGAGFISWWPVIYNDKVIFTRTVEARSSSSDLTGLPKFNVIEAEVIGVGSDGNPAGQIVDHTIGSQTKAVDVSVNPNTATTIPDWLEANTYARNVFVLNQSTGSEVQFDTDGDSTTDGVPMLIAMQPPGNMYPPVQSGFDNILYFRLPLLQSGAFAGSLVHGWEYGTRYISLPVSGDWAIDEPFGFSAGGKYFYWNHCCDRSSGSFDLSLSNTSWPNTTSNRQWQHLDWGPTGGAGDNKDMLPDNYWQQMEQYWWFGNPSQGGFSIEGDTVGPAIYDGKMYVVRSNALLAFAPNGAGKTAPMSDAPAPSGGETAGVPPVSALFSILESEVQKIVAAGHLKPGFGVTGGFDFRAIQTYGDNLLDYWHYPGDIHYVLLRALPYLSPSLQTQVRTYLQSEFALFPPYQYGHTGWKDGVFRESFVWPPQMAANVAASGPGNSLWAGFYSWSPHQFYALWLYAKAGLGDPLTIFNAAKNKLPTTAPSVPAHFPQALNAYIAGYYGYVELAKLAGQPYATQENILNTLMSQRASTFTADLVNPDTSAGSNYYYTLRHAYNFMYLTPELGDYLNQHAKAKVQTAVDSYTANAPLWLETFNHEVHGENITTPYQQTHALFQAKALILKESYEELAKNLDAPMMLGDLYYLDNLIAVLEASSSSPTPTSSPQQTGDIEPTGGDGDVDLNDYQLLLGGFGTSNCAINVMGTCLIDIFDFNTLLSNFGS